MILILVQRISFVVVWTMTIGTAIRRCDALSSIAAAGVNANSIKMSPASSVSSEWVQEQPAASSAESYNREAIVVGGGPVGLTAALVLSNPPHCYNVTVLEQTDAVATYDPTRAYLYNVNPRGLKMLDKFPSAIDKLEERGTAPQQGMGKICYIPADPDVPIQPPGSIQMSGQSTLMKKRRNFWIPRHQMVELLEECCYEQEGKRIQYNDTTIGSIRIFRKGFESLETSDDSPLITAKCSDGSSYKGCLVVGADGVDSRVRQCLSEASTTTGGWIGTSADPKKFIVKRYRSPSTGIKMKSLQFPPQFTLTNTSGAPIPTESDSMYVFRGKNKGTRTEFSIGFLPVKDPNMIRPGNTNTRHDHEIWKIRNGPQMKQFFQTNFPRVDWDSIVSDTEWERYALANGTTFPYCQYSPGSAVIEPKQRKSGIVLIGDACHAFPPDIGQGINAGLQDVLALDRSLSSIDITTGQSTATTTTSEEGEESIKTVLLGDALLAYQKNRGPEHKALIRLARCGAPYQYRQTWTRDRIGRFLWTVNVIFRMILNKLSFGMIPPSAMLIMQNHGLTYRQVYRRAAATARIIKVLIAAMAWILWKRTTVGAIAP